MADKTNSLEAWLNELFVDSTPKLPDNAKKALTAWASIIAAAAGFLLLFSAWSLWHWATVAESVINYANSVCTTYSGYSCAIPVSRFSIWLWLGVLFLTAEGLLCFFAYPHLKNRKKEGWNYLYYGALINVAYAAVSLFASYDVVGHFFGSIIGSVIGFYLLFQIREAYLEPKRVAPTKPTSKDES